MRTTIDLDDDTARAIDRLRAESGLGLSAAVNELIRRGLVPREAKRPFVQRSQSLGLRVDVSNIGDVLETLEGPDFR